MAKTKVDAKQLFKDTFSAIRRANKRNQITVSGLIQREVISSIRKGKSPVRGEGRYKRYSDSYIKRIMSKKFKEQFGKRVSPVNLRLTGAMLKSIFRNFPKNKIVIGFKSEIAFFHQTGAGNLPVRKLLPDASDRGFNVIITRKVTALIEKNLDRELRSRR